MSTPQRSPDELLDFWFGPLDSDGLPSADASRRWFAGGDAFDAEIRERYGELVERALAGTLDAWADTPRGLLALVIVLDQFPRNLFRGEARAFAGDPLALSLARDAVDAGWAQRLLPAERVFLYLPFEHAESLEEQDRCCALYADLVATCPPAARKLVAGNLAYAERHRDTIRRFGRFPARNLALGRESTADERVYLAEHPAGF